MFKGFKVKGMTISDLALSMGLVAGMMIGGLQFYNINVSKSQAVSAMQAGKIVADQISDFIARRSYFPSQYDVSTLIYDSSDAYVNEAYWVQGDDLIDGQPWGFVQLTYKDGIHRLLAGKTVRFYFARSADKANMRYVTCRTNLSGGMLWGELGEMEYGMPSIILPECLFGLAGSSASSMSELFGDVGNYTMSAELNFSMPTVSFELAEEGAQSESGESTATEGYMDLDLLSGEVAGPSIMDEGWTETVEYSDEDEIDYSDDLQGSSEDFAEDPDVDYLDEVLSEAPMEEGWLDQDESSLDAEDTVVGDVYDETGTSTDEAAESEMSEGAEQYEESAADGEVILEDSAEDEAQAEESAEDETSVEESAAAQDNPVLTLFMYLMELLVNQL